MTRMTSVSRRALRFCTAAVVVLLAAMAAAAALPSVSRARAGDPFSVLLEERMPDLLAKYGVPGSVVSYIENGEVVWTQAYGMADVGSGRAMQPDMLLEHGSNGKALTAWAVMKLVEQGKVDLDAPVNSYLKRWQVTSDRYDASQVTLRRLLSHTAGFNIHGYVDYSSRRAKLPDPVRVLEERHILEGLAEALETGDYSSGRAELVAEPGAGFKYSGAGYTVAQMVLEDVTGEPFASFVQREITDPLGAVSIRWAWTPELAARAPTPYGNEIQPLEKRQLAVQGIGSEIATVEDFARFLVAAVPGPNGEPVGRGVLQPESVREMTHAQPATDGGYGLGYGIGRDVGEPAISHSGANTGWTAYYFLDTTRRTGLVVASNSSRAAPLHISILGLWSDATFGPAVHSEQPPDPRFDVIGVASAALAGILALALLFSAVRSGWQIHTGRRVRATQLRRSPLLFGLLWLAWLAFIWYTIYSPLPLFLPYNFPDLWPTLGSKLLMAVITGWVIYSVVASFYVRAPARARTAKGEALAMHPTPEVLS